MSARGVVGGLTFVQLLTAAFVVSLVASGAAILLVGADSTVVESCGTVDEPGVYHLGSDLRSTDRTCLDVRASDVVIDGRGHALVADGRGNTTGVSVADPALRNVVVRDLTVRGFDIGVLHLGADGRLVDVTATANRDGVYLLGATNATLTDVTATGNGRGVVVDAATDVRLVGGRVADSGGAGLSVLGSAGTDVTDLTAADNARGVYVESSTDSRLTGVVAVRNAEFGLFLNDSSGAVVADAVVEGTGDQRQQDYGVLLWRSDGNSLTNASVSNVHHGVYVDFSDDTAVTSSRVVGTSLGVVVESASGTLIADNEVVGSEFGGVVLWRMSEATRVENNRIADGWYGVALVGPGPNPFVSRSFLGDDGPFVFGSTGNTLRGNVVEDNRAVGVALWDDSDANLLEGNVVRDNGDDGILLSRGSDRTRLVGNEVSGNAGDGVELDAVEGTTLTDNRVCDNGGSPVVDGGVATRTESSRECAA
jgi:parallel beta-helix repeat protein